MTARLAVCVTAGLPPGTQTRLQSCRSSARVGGRWRDRWSGASLTFMTAARQWSPIIWLEPFLVPPPSDPTTAPTPPGAVLAGRRRRHRCGVWGGRSARLLWACTWVLQAWARGSPSCWTRLGGIGGDAVVCVSSSWNCGLCKLCVVVYGSPSILFYPVNWSPLLRRGMIL